MLAGEPGQGKDGHQADQDDSHHRARCRPGHQTQATKPAESPGPLELRPNLVLEATARTASGEGGRDLALELLQLGIVQVTQLMGPPA